MAGTARERRREQGIRLEACGSHTHTPQPSQQAELLDGSTFIQEKEGEIPNTRIFVFIPN